MTPWKLECGAFSWVACVTADPSETTTEGLTVHTVIGKRFPTVTSDSTQKRELSLDISVFTPADKIEAEGVLEAARGSSGEIRLTTPFNECLLARIKQSTRTRRVTPPGESYIRYTVQLIVTGTFAP